MGLANTVHGPDLASCLELCCLAHVPWAKNGFYIFKWLKKIKRRIIFGDTGKLCEIQIAVFIKFYWNIWVVTLACFHIVFGHFCTMIAVEQLEWKVYGLTNLSLALYRKFVDPWLNEINLCMEEKSPKLCFFISIAVFYFSFQD